MDQVTRSAPWQDVAEDMLETVKKLSHSADVLVTVNVDVRDKAKSEDPRAMQESEDSE